MPPPAQPPQPPASRVQPHTESPSLANAQPPTPTPGNKTITKKAAKEGSRPKRRATKNPPAPATPNASEPPTPTTPITPHAPVPFNQVNPAATNQAPLSQGNNASQTNEQQTGTSSQDTAPTAFGAIDHATDGEAWLSSADDKSWMAFGMEPGFSNVTLGDLGNFSSASMTMDDEMVNYSEFLNDNDGMVGGMEFSTIWGDDLGGTGAEV
jgi:hypothetical protein